MDFDLEAPDEVSEPSPPSLFAIVPTTLSLYFRS